MSYTVKQQIEESVDQVTVGLNTKNADVFLDMIHPDMVWPWPPTSRDHDPIWWEFVLGRFNKEPWRQNFQAIFDDCDLLHNHRDTVKIEIAAEQDAALAVVDGDSLWREKNTKQEIHWKVCICKIYSRMAAADWKLIFQTGPLDYGLCRDS
jgi:ketosteroid isomerase-like protein